MRGESDAETPSRIDIEVAKVVETSARCMQSGTFNFRGLNFVVEFWKNTWTQPQEQ